MQNVKQRDFFCWRSTVGRFPFRRL